MNFKKPLEGITVVDFSQFLSGPSASLRLADLGARVIKIERSDGGDICRTLYTSNLEIDGDSSLFHAINRNKESFSANLKNEADSKLVRQLIRHADVVIQNFRPDVMERLGFHYDAVKEINPRIVYGEVTGYGERGPWKNKPGQDLLVQSISGVTWLNDEMGAFPRPFGLAIVDMIAGIHLSHGILSCLVKRAVSGEGSFVQVSMLESIMDFQTDVFSTFLNDETSSQDHKNAEMYKNCRKPYKVYKTSNSYIALEKQSIEPLVKHLKKDPNNLTTLFLEKTTEEWVKIIEELGLYCSEVKTWDQIIEADWFKKLNMVQSVTRDNEINLLTTRCPIQIDKTNLVSSKGSPRIGENNVSIIKEFNLI